MRAKFIIIRHMDDHEGHRDSSHDEHDKVRVEGTIVNAPFGKEHDVKFSFPYEQAANALMSAEGFSKYVEKHGYHFTPELADYVCSLMVNRNGKTHTWTTSQVKKAMSGMGLSVPKEVSDGDAAYLANMYYADLYPDPLTEEVACLKAAYNAANDPDGYEGKVFCRWTSDAIGKAIKIDWKNYI